MNQVYYTQLAMYLSSNLKTFFTYSNKFEIKEGSAPVWMQVETEGCKDTISEVNYIENVQLTVNLRYPFRGNLRITLFSPGGMLYAKYNILKN